MLFYTKELSDINGENKPGIVHRLDKDTSGIMVVAKDNKTHRFLAKQFKEHTIKKVYIAIVSGSVDSTVRVWDVETGEELSVLTGHLDTVTSVAFRPGRKQIVSGSFDKSIKVWRYGGS